MSENQENPLNPEFNAPAAPFAEGPATQEVETHTQNEIPMEANVDGQSYFLGEVPQAHLVDPSAFLPLNSDRLLGSINMVEKLLFEVSSLVEEEVTMIQKHQKRIMFWEDRIEKNKTVLQKQQLRIKQNTSDALLDKKNRNYWIGRAEEVETDYSHSEVSNRTQDWGWLIKKYGLKNADGTEISSTSPCVEELCNGETKNLAAEYRSSAHQYDHARKEKEAENNRLVRENAKLLNSNELLQGYISAAYMNDIEPLQDGILLLKELGAKLKSLAEDERASYGVLRAWAESFLNDFLKNNSRTPQAVVTSFRKLTSIPLPPEYC